MPRWPRFSADIAIDLGTANTYVYVGGRGIVLKEPSIVAVNTKDGQVHAVGTEAHAMLGRTPPNLTAVRPLKAGVIADFNVTERMLAHFIKKAQSGTQLGRPRLIIGVPSSLTSVERRAIEDVAHRAKASEVHLVEEPVAAAMGADLPIASPVGTMMVDIGGGTTDVVVISLGGVAARTSLPIAGHAMDEAIMHHFRKRHSVLIGDRTAEEVKMALGSAMPVTRSTEKEVKGRHAGRGLPCTVTVTGGEIQGALEKTVGQIIEAVKETLERTPPELSADISEHGIVLNGGGSLLAGFDRRVTRDTGLPARWTEDPMGSVVLGAGRMFADIELLRRLSSDRWAA
jgi:rod shape-determining protein MreB